MTKKRNQKPKTTTATFDADVNYPGVGRFRCRYRTLQRLCHAQKISVTQLLIDDGVKESTARDRNSSFKHGKNVDISVYEQLGRLLNCEPTSLYFTNDPPLEPEDPAWVFAERIQLLIDHEDSKKRIPVVNETGQRTNIVEYVWQMGDNVLDNLRMTYLEQIEGFLLLRDTYGRVKEEPIPRGKRIGRMIIGEPPVEDIVADVEARQVIGTQTFDLLCSQFTSERFFHIDHILGELPVRLRRYYSAVKNCFPDIDENLFDYREAETQSTIHEGNQIGVSDNSQLSNKELEQRRQKKIRDVIDADYDVRRLMYFTIAQEELFRLTYGRSRGLVLFLDECERDKFDGFWWRGFVIENSQDLRQLGRAWKKLKPKRTKVNATSKRWIEEQFEQMKDAFIETTDRTKEFIREYYT